MSNDADIEIEGTDEQRRAFKEKLKSLQFSSTVRSSKERSLDRVIDMPRDEFYRLKDQVKNA